MSKIKSERDYNEALGQSKQPAGLYVVATPIGNLGDITLRALELLKSADTIVCEDTRVTQKLLRYYGITTPLLTYNDHNATKIRPRILKELAQNKVVALVSDAGTPLISDPGYKLIQEVQEQGNAITTLPGPCAAIGALTLAGLPTDRFFFAGFLPPRKQARQKQLSSLAAINATLVFYESARRIPAVLTEMQEIFGKDREAVLVRELTKKFEEVKRESLTSLAKQYKNSPPKGEVVLLIGPPKEQAISQEELDTILQKALGTMSLKDAVASTVSQLSLPKKQVYARALELKDD